MFRFAAHCSIALALGLFARGVCAAPEQAELSRARPDPTELAAHKAETTRSISGKPGNKKSGTHKAVNTAHKAEKHGTGKTHPPDGKTPTAKPAEQAAATHPVPVIAADSKAADAKADGTKPVETKAAPHFASLRAEKVNLRSGPSEDFPIQWVFKRRGLPVEILASFDIWRKVHAFDGTEGWINQQMLTGRRSVLITGPVRTLRSDPDPASAAVAQLEPGVVAAMLHCNPAWCELKAGGYKGWLKREELWGVEPDEVIP